MDKKILGASVGERIRKARKAAGLSQDDLADALDTTQATISRWQSDAGPMKLKDVERVAEALGVHAHDLLCEARPAGLSDDEGAVLHTWRTISLRRAIDIMIDMLGR